MFYVIENIFKKMHLFHVQTVSRKMHCDKINNMLLVHVVKLTVCLVHSEFVNGFCKFLVCTI